MARSPSGRRGRGAADLGGTLGSLLRSTLEQAGAVREAFERSARTSLGDRKRASLLGELGEIVLELVRRGEIDLEELPEIRDVVEALDRHDEGGGQVRARSTRVTRGYGERDDATLRRAVSQTPRYAFDERDVVARRGQRDRPGDTDGGIDEELGEEFVEYDNELEQDGDGGAGPEIPGIAPRSRRGEPEELGHHGLDALARGAVTQRLRSFSEPLRRAFARGFERGDEGYEDEDGASGDERDDLDGRDDRDDAELLAAAARGEGLEEPAGPDDRDDRDDLSAARRQGRDRQAGPTRPGYLRKGEAILRSITGQASAPRRRETGDGTVSSSSWRREPGAKTQRVWRPVFEDAPEAPGAQDAREDHAASEVAHAREAHAGPKDGGGARDARAAHAGPEDRVRAARTTPEDRSGARDARAAHAGPAGPGSSRPAAAPQVPASVPAPAASSASRTPVAEPIEIPGVVRYDDLQAAAADEEPERPSRPSPLAPSLGRSPRSGGISFDDDDDLEQYMHPDDVPPKP